MITLLNELCLHLCVSGNMDSEKAKGVSGRLNYISFSNVCGKNTIFGGWFLVTTPNFDNRTKTSNRMKRTLAIVFIFTGISLFLSQDINAQTINGLDVAEDQVILKISAGEFMINKENGVFDLSNTEPMTSPDIDVAKAVESSGDRGVEVANKAGEVIGTVYYDPSTKEFLFR